MMQHDYEYEVSVYCVTYNHEKYIRDALEGFFMQKTDFDWKLVIHDDASTDGTQDIIREYTDMYPDKIVSILQTENQYSQGIDINKITSKYLKGKYIASCEGDDYWIDPYKLQKQYDFLQQNSDFSGCYHNIVELNNKEEQVTSKEFPYKEEFEVEKKVNAKLQGQTASAFYRNIFMLLSEEQKQKFFECKANGDRRIAVTLSCLGKVEFLKDCMAAHRVIETEGDSWHARSYGKNMAQEKMEGWIALKEYVREAFNEELDISEEEKCILWSGFSWLVKNPSRDNWNIFVNVWGMTTGNIKKIVVLLSTALKKIMKCKSGECD